MKRMTLSEMVKIAIPGQTLVIPTPGGDFCEAYIFMGKVSDVDFFFYPLFPIWRDPDGYPFRGEEPPDHNRPPEFATGIRRWATYDADEEFWVANREDLKDLRFHLLSFFAGEEI